MVWAFSDGVFIYIKLQKNYINLENSLSLKKKEFLKKKSFLNKKISTFLKKN